MKRKIICVACLMLIGLLAGCKKNAEEEKNVESSKEVQLDSTNMPLEISANVEKRLNGQRIKVKVIEDGGGFQTDDEVLVEYKQVVIAHGEEAVRNIGTEEYEELPEQGTHIIVSFWENEKKKEDGKEILAGSQITIQEKRDSQEIIQSLKKKIDKITISYISSGNTDKENKVISKKMSKKDNKENAEEKLTSGKPSNKEINDKGQIGKILDKLQVAYHTLDYQLDAYEIEDFQGYCVTICEGEKEYGIIKINEQGECELLVKRQLPWRQAYYKADEGFYQWVDTFYKEK